MDNCPLDILLHIVNFINEFEYLFSLIQVNRFYYQEFCNHFKNSFNDYLKLINNKFPTFIRNLFINICFMRVLPQIEFKDSFLGPTGSIDQITRSEVIQPVMYGIDNNNNTFLILKLKIKTIINSLSQQIETIITIFQKSYFNYRWCISSNESYYGIFFNNIIEYMDIRLLTQLINKQTINYRNSELWL